MQSSTTCASGCTRISCPVSCCACLDPMQMMEGHPKVQAMPVVDDGMLVGLVTLHALVTAGL